MLVALWSVPALMALSPRNLPRINEAGLDYQAILFAVGASVLTSILFGLAPALGASRLDINDALKASANRKGGSSNDSRLRGLLVISEVALALVLLVGAALLTRSFVQLRGEETGFNTENLATLQVSLTSARYRTTDNAWRFQQQVMDRISNLPGVTSVAVTSSLPLERGLNSFASIMRGAENFGQSVECRPISQEYFNVLGVRLLGGRGFSESDAGPSPPVIIINQTMARVFWGEGEPIGQMVKMDGKDMQVVGLVNDIKEMGLDKPASPTVYVPMAQVSDSLMASMNRWFLTSWIARTSGPQDLTAALRDAVAEVDPQMPIARTRPMTEVLEGSITSHTFVLSLMAIFAGLAVTLTSIGIYGVLSYQVTERTREIGIRMALGASSGNVLRLVIRQGMTFVVIGIVVGLAMAYAMTRLMDSWLYKVSATDFVTFAGISIVLALVALAACIAPARRASRVDPMIALRHE